MKISRRDFIRYMGISGGLAGGLPRVLAMPDGWLEKLGSGPHLESWKVSTCGQCPAGCGIRVRLIDGLPVRIKGNPIAPVNRGFLCPMGEAGLELLYHPDRILQPLKLSGKKGVRQWDAIKWHHALGRIATALSGLVKDKKTSRFGFLLGDKNTGISRMAGEFVRAMESPNFLPWRTPSVNELGFRDGLIRSNPFSFDLDKCDYLLTFGTNLLEELPSPVYFNRLYGRMKARRAGAGQKMVHIDARMSQAGINGTEWVRIRPGTMGVLSLGMVYVILRDKAQDRPFIDGHSSGFSGGEDDFVSLVMKDYYPKRVAEVTAVPAQTIIRIAREFSSAKAPIALSGGLSDRSEMALFNQWAVLCLNAISGSFSVEGLWREAPGVPWDDKVEFLYNTDSSSFSSKEGEEYPTGFPASWAVESLPDILSEKQGPLLDVLFIAEVDPVYQATNRAKWHKFLSKIPLVVQFTALHNDTSPFADLILPVPTYLEQWEISLPVPNLPFSNLGLMQPVIDRRAETRPLGDILIHLWKKLDLKYPESDQPGSYETYVQSRMNEVFMSGRGTPYFEEISLEFLEELKKRGWQVYSYPSFSDFWRILREKGGWWEPEGTGGIDWNKERQFRFLTAGRLKELLKKRASSAYDREKEQIGKSPHLWLEKSIRKEDSSKNFILYPFSCLFNITGEGASQPLLQELLGVHHHLYWKTWAEMHPERAAKLGIEDGDMIRIVSDRSSFHLPVKVVPTVSQEILAVPLGEGHKGLGRYARNIGHNPLEIIDERRDLLSSIKAWQSTVVRVEPVKE